MTPRSSLELNLNYTVATYSEPKKKVQGYTNYHNVAGAIGLALKA